MNEVKIIFNILCNKRVRITRLCSLVEQIVPLCPNYISIRLRGQFANEAKSSLEEIFSNLHYALFKIRVGDTFKSWKINSLEQIMHDGPEVGYIGMFQEDFKFMAPPSLVVQYVQGAMKNQVDAIQLDSAPFYSILAPQVTALRRDWDQYVTTLDLNRRNIPKTGRVVHALTSWPAIYKTELVLKALTSARPFIKKFHPDFPFDWEKSTKALWLLPYRWCSPRFELLSCVDYDSLWPRSSLQNRGLVSDHYQREDDTLDGLTKRSNLVLTKLNGNFEVIQKKVFPNSEEALMNLKHRLKGYLKLFHSIRFSFIAIIAYFSRFNERDIRRAARLKIVRRTQ